MGRRRVDGKRIAGFLGSLMCLLVCPALGLAQVAPDAERMRGGYGYRRMADDARRSVDRDRSVADDFRRAVDGYKREDDPKRQKVPGALRVADQQKLDATEAK